MLTDSWIIVSSLTVCVCAASESWDRGRWWCGSDADVALTSVTGPAVCTIGVGLTADSVDCAVIVEWCS
jgi:hypothetical protein